MRFECFTDSSYAKTLLGRGKAVQVYLDPEKTFGNYRDTYAAMLGFELNRKGELPEFMLCYITQEIGNMQGHYIVAGVNGPVVYGILGDQFYIKLDEYDTEDEL
tara:strand:+ start:5990 stop:6301 length:312 start_codon:yes stop_codon:yes gene_type:complete